MGIVHGVHALAPKEPSALLLNGAATAHAVTFGARLGNSYRIWRFVKGPLLGFRWPPF